jgi:predicted nuclease of restriction endonuclease-like (RecB) superfamily
MTEPTMPNPFTLQPSALAEYQDWLAAIKQRIVSTRLRMALAASRELIQFYWELGALIAHKQAQSQWGDKLIAQLSADLQKAFPDLKGLSVSNLKYCLRFFQFYSDPQGSALTAETPAPFGQQPVDQMPWGHNILIFTKCASVAEASFYLSQTLEHGWSRDVLAMQLKSQLHTRIGKAVTNFSRTLPPPQSDLAQQTLKDPYTFDFMAMTAPYNERDVERQLTQHITQFLLELGKGFAFMGKQYHLEIACNDYYIDLLFYHVTLKCYVVVELKNRKFIPEYAGKLNFYLSAVDSLLKREDDQPTIGLLLCRDKNNIEVEFALRDMNKPMGVSEYTLVETLPDNLKGALPTVEEIESDLQQLQQQTDDDGAMNE